MDPDSDWVASGGKLALDFDGSDDSVSTSSFAISREITTSVSISVWMTLRAVGRQSTMFGFESGSRMQTHCPWSDGNIYWDFGGSAAPNRLTVSGQSFALNAWNHMVFIAGAIGSQVWRNGLLIGSSSTAISRTAGNDFFSIGKTGADRHSGQIDDFTVYNTALTANEVREIYRLGRGYGVFPEPDFDEGFAAAGFKAYWARRQSQLIGGGV
jgi:hypothetical protein